MPAESELVKNKIITEPNYTYLLNESRLIYNNYLSININPHKIYDAGRSSFLFKN